jgi:hypothetical protein
MEQSGFLLNPYFTPEVNEWMMFVWVVFSRWHLGANEM